MTGEKVRLNRRHQGADGEIHQRIDFLTVVSFAMNVGLPGCLQALRNDC
jgi:hypothetical protein